MSARRWTGPATELAGPGLSVLVDCRECLIAQRTSIVNALRWNLHELDPSTEIQPRWFRRLMAYRLVHAQFAAPPCVTSD
jgi:hypothetical protein